MSQETERLRCSILQFQFKLVVGQSSPPGEVLVGVDGSFAVFLLAAIDSLNSVCAYGITLNHD